MLDFLSKVITEYRADTSDHKAKLKELQGEERKLAQERLKQADEHNKGLDSQIERLGNMNQALGLITTAVGVAKDAWKTYSDNLRLTAAAGSANIEALRAASLGLRTEHELLSFAAQTQHGVIKANQTQMETAQKAMVALTRAGFDQAEVTKKVTDAMVSLKVNGLDDFGITVQKGKTDLETYTNLMDELGKKASGVEEGNITAAESIDKLGVTMADAIEKMKIALGQLVAALQPMIESLAETVGLVGKLASVVPGGTLGKVGKYAQYLTPGGQFRAAAGYLYGLTTQPEQSAFPSFNALGGEFGEDQTPFDIAAQFGGGPQQFGTFEESIGQSYTRGFGELRGGKTSSRLQARLEAMAEQAQKAQEIAKRLAEERKKLSSDVAKALTDDLLNSLEEDTDRSVTGGAIPVVDLSGFDEQTQAIALAMEKMNAQNYELFRAQKQKSFLESTFGTLDEFNAYASAFQMLTGAVSAGLTAWIDGSMSAGQAIKKFIAEALKGLASQMAVEALKHGAYALGSLAFGDVRGAGQHAAAAAAFAGVATAAAVAAKASAPSVSASGGGGQAGAGAGGVSRGTSSGGPGQTVNYYTIVAGDSHADDSPRMQQNKARRLAALADGRTSASRAE